MAQPIRRQPNDEERARQLAASRAYAARVARDPEIARRIAAARAELDSGGFDEADVISYEEMLKRLRGDPPAR